MSSNHNHPYCEPIAIHAGWMHNISAASISSWFNPIDSVKVAATAMEIPFVLSEESSNKNNTSPNNNTNNVARFHPFDPSNAINNNNNNNNQNMQQVEFIVGDDDENEHNNNNIKNKNNDQVLLNRDEQKIIQLGVAHFEFLLKDEDLSDDRHLKRIMELLVVPGLVLSDHCVPRWQQQNNSNSRVGSFLDASQQQQQQNQNNPQQQQSTVKTPLKWNWTVLNLAQNHFLAVFISLSTFDEYSSLGFAIHLECDSLGTALRQARWMMACGAVRLLLMPPEKENPNLKIHEDFVKEVAEEAWKSLEKQRWQHFLSAIARYTLPKKKRYRQATERFFECIRLPNNNNNNVTSSALSSPNQKQQREEGNTTPSAQNIVDGEASKKNKNKNKKTIPEDFKIPIVKPTPFHPSLTKSLSPISSAIPLPPVKYILLYQSMLSDIFHQAYSIQLSTDGLPPFVWQAWRNFFHLTFFSLFSSMNESDSPLSVCHSSLCEGLVPGMLITSTPKTRKGMWEDTLHIKRFNPTGVAAREESAFVGPAIGLFGKPVSPSQQDSQVVDDFFKSLVPLLEEQRLYVAHMMTNNNNNQLPKGTVSYQQQQQIMETSETNLWQIPQCSLFNFILSWRSSVERAVSNLEFRILRLYSCGMSLAAKRTQLSAACSNINDIGDPSFLASFSVSEIQQLLLVSLENDSCSIFAWCKCDRCLEDAELILNQCDPFVERLLNSTAKQLVRLFRKWIRPMFLIRSATGIEESSAVGRKTNTNNTGSMTMNQQQQQKQQSTTNTADRIGKLLEAAKMEREQEGAKNQTKINSLSSSPSSSKSAAVFSSSISASSTSLPNENSSKSEMFVSSKTTETNTTSTSVVQTEESSSSTSPCIDVKTLPITVEREDGSEINLKDLYEQNQTGFVFVVRLLEQINKNVVDAKIDAVISAQLREQQKEKEKEKEKPSLPTTTVVTSNNVKNSSQREGNNVNDVKNTDVLRYMKESVGRKLEAIHTSVKQQQQTTTTVASAVAAVIDSENKRIELAQSLSWLISLANNYNLFIAEPDLRIILDHGIDKKQFLKLKDEKMKELKFSNAARENFHIIIKKERFEKLRRFPFVRECEVTINWKEKLGAGSTAVVRGATLERDPRPYAAKLFLDNVCDKDEFQREIRTACHLSHGNIVRLTHIIVDDGDEEKIVGLLMEKMGKNLQKFIKEDKPSVEVILKYCLDAANGVACCHQKGVIHSDIKPENILLSLDGSHACLTDFGSASVLNTTIRISIGRVAGTPLFIDPLFEKTGATKKADIFSFGMTLWDVLHNNNNNNIEFSFDHGLGKTEAEIRENKLEGKRPPISDTAVPKKMKELIQDCWNAEPKERPNIQEVVKVLGEVLMEMKRK